MAGGQIMRFTADEASRTFGSADGLARAVVSSLFEDSHGLIWAGSGAGLSRFADDRWTSLRVESAGKRQNVTAIAQDQDGNFWLGVRSGVMRVPVTDLAAAVADPSRPIEQPLYDMDDGLNGLPIWLGYPTVARSGDGRLWFVTSDGLSAFDPRLIAKHRLAPPVRIESIKADDHEITPAVDEQLPPLTSRLQIDYTGISFTVPSKVQFRYKLEGFDADWIDAGARRQAFYTNLRPRAYRFRVMAGNDGAWNEAGATLDFSILPAFYQTTWFRLAVIATVALGAWGAWRLRVRRVREQFDVVLGERARMAREIHDTLLQTLVGVTLQFNTLDSQLDSSAGPVRRELDRLRKQLEQCIREARQSILDLRSPVPGSDDLADAIREVVDKQTREAAVTFELVITGKPRPSGPRVTQQLLRIAQEAVTNAMRHADATRIRIEIIYDESSVALRVSDNGRGFDPARPVFTPEDHWGLANMKERADQIGAQFRLTSSPGAGTEIETIVSTASSPAS
jgi:signal transduction histidine kinase